MNVLDHLLSLIDNGGRRTYIKRRCINLFRVIPPRRTRPDRRNIVDRRKIPNEPRMNGPERREVFKEKAVGCPMAFEIQRTCLKKLERDIDPL